MKIRPLRDFIAVTKEEGPKQTTSGLYLAPTAEEKMITGTVVAVGSGRVAADGKVVPLEVALGDKVAFNRNLATELKSGDDTFLLIREDQLVAVV